MPHVSVGSAGADPIDIYFEDHGAGTPVVLSHGYPLSGRAWEKQVAALLAAGYRVITYDRRGWGNSSQPADGYDYDTFASDLNVLLTTLDVRDAILVGHSMGTGDVARYLGRYGTGRVAKAVLMSPIPPFLLKTDDNPEGAPQSLFDGFIEAARADRNGWLTQFLQNFYNLDVYGGSLVSDEAFQASVHVAQAGSPVAAVACIPTWLTDFREDLAKVDVPVLVIQGDQDRVLPLGVTGQRVPAFVVDARLLVIEGGPHAIAWTHADQVNAALLDFLQK
ncbi:alpha/beta fold hydrolase [Micromonospora sp. WMMD736]|uniref:alpha/beta fold hydrolase n=1 Tax=Micromonospora sp. WMMD736 TaxID=3404112 RepID=UPI003B92B345